jgi:hypothetical protein
MYEIKPVFQGKEQLTLFERKIRLKRKYRFNSKSIFLDFIEMLTKTVNLESSSFKAQVLNEFADTLTSKYDDLINIINTSDNIYRIKLEIIGESSVSTHAIIAEFSELESFKNRSYIKLISTEKDWIKISENLILERLSLHKSVYSLISNDLSDFLFLSFLVYTLLITVIGTDFANKLNYTNFFIIMVYSGIIFFVYSTFKDIFMPTFKIKTKASLNKRILMQIRKDPFTNILSILSIILGIIALF